MTRGTRSRRVLLVGVAVLAVVLAVGAGFLAQPRSGAPSGRLLAQDVLSQAPVPPGSVATESVIKSLSEPPSIVGCSPMWDLHRTYVLDSSTDVRSFVESHLGKDNTVTGSGYSGGPGEPTVTFLTVTLASSPGSKALLILYSMVPSRHGSQALRVDAQVTLSTSRCVTHGSPIGTSSPLPPPVLIGRNLTGESNPPPTPGSKARPPSCTPGEVICPL